MSRKQLTEIIDVDARVERPQRQQHVVQQVEVIGRGGRQYHRAVAAPQRGVCGAGRSVSSCLGQRRARWLRQRQNKMRIRSSSKQSADSQTAGRLHRVISQSLPEPMLSCSCVGGRAPQPLTVASHRAGAVVAFVLAGRRCVAAAHSTQQHTPTRPGMSNRCPLRNQSSLCRWRRGSSSCASI
jgi:hypothetical protein